MLILSSEPFQDPRFPFANGPLPLPCQPEAVKEKNSQNNNDCTLQDTNLTKYIFLSRGKMD
jgi:hypothetical protein